MHMNAYFEGNPPSLLAVYILSHVAHILWPITSVYMHTNAYFKGNAPSLLAMYILSHVAHIF